MIYYLYNKKTNEYLTHPSVGVWSSENKEEAQDMLNSFKTYLKSYPDYEESDLEILEKKC